MNQSAGVKITIKCNDTATYTVKAYGQSRPFTLDAICRPTNFFADALFQKYTNVRGCSL